MMLTREHRGPVLAAAGAAAALTVAAWLAVAAPLLARRHEASQLQQQAAAAAVDLAKARDALRLVEQRVAELDRQLAADPLRLQLPTYLNRRVAELTELAGACGLELRGVQPQPAVAGGEIVRVPLQVSGQGTYRAVTAFLDALHERVGDVSVTGLHVEATGAGTGPTDNAARFLVHVDWHARNDAQAAVP